MKKIISLIFILIICLLILEWSSTFIKNNHELEYIINSDTKSFRIIEKYQKNMGDTYYLEITNNEKSFIYNVDNNFNKQKEIIKSIQFYEENNILCIYPNLTNDITLSIQCSDNKNIYSYESIKNESYTTKFISILKEKGYENTSWDSENNTKEMVDSYTVYRKNILKNDNIIIWNYKGIDIISDSNNKYHKLYQDDKYENNHGTLVGKYYVVPVYSNSKVLDFDSLNVINLENSKSEIINLDVTLNQDTYINGVVDNRLYYFDPDNIVQYEIDPHKKRISVVGNKDTDGQFYNGDWESINIYDFVGTKKKFKLDIPDEIKKYNPVFISQSDTSYYYMTSDNSFYKINKNNLEKSILLWKISGLKEVKVIDDIIYFIVGDTLNYYSDNTGIKKIIKNNEWNYNFNNIYDIYKETK